MIVIISCKLPRLDHIAHLKASRTSNKHEVPFDPWYNQHKTIGDEGITVDFWLIKVHTSNWSSNNWGSSNGWALPHQARIELSDFHARVWKSDQGGRNSMQEMHGNQTKCMEFQPIKKSSNFWTSILCPGINFSCSKSLWIWWTIDPLILACLKLMTYASFSTKQLLAVLMDGNPCTNGWNSMHQNRKNVIASCFFEQSCLRQVKIQDPWQI